MFTQPYIQIYKVNRGWFVKVGCQELIFSHSEKAEMIQAFSDLILLGQEEAQNKWCDKGCSGQGQIYMYNPENVAALSNTIGPGKILRT